MDPDLCVDGGPARQGARAPGLQAPSGCQVEGALAVTGLLVPLAVRTGLPGAGHVTAAAEAGTADRGRQQALVRTFSTETMAGRTANV